MTPPLEITLQVDGTRIAEYVGEIVRKELLGALALGSKQALSISEAAAALSVSRSAAYDLVKSGELPTIAIGSRKIVPVAALEEWVRAHTAAATKTLRAAS